MLIERRLALECKCYHPSHFVVMGLDTYEFDQDPELTIHVQMNPLPFFKRLKLAFKYVFGKYGKEAHWDSFLLKESQSKELTYMLEEFRILTKMAKNDRSLAK